MTRKNDSVVMLSHDTAADNGPQLSKTFKTFFYVEFRRDHAQDLDLEAGRAFILGIRGINQ